MRKAAVKTWGREMGISEHTLKKRLMEQGHSCEPGDKFTTREVFRATVEDPSVARARESKARAELLEAKLKREAGELVPVTEVRQMLVTFGLTPVREMLLSLHLEASDLEERKRIRKRIDDALKKLKGVQKRLGLKEVADAAA